MPFNSAIHRRQATTFNTKKTPSVQYVVMLVVAISTLIAFVTVRRCCCSPYLLSLKCDIAVLGHSFSLSAAFSKK